LEVNVKDSPLRELYVEQLQDLYNAESQLIKALPKMADAADSEELRSAFEEHLEQTRQHVERLEEIFERLGEKAKGEKCKGMEGLIKEGSEVMKEDLPEPVKDAALIAAAQRVEHYEIAGYGTVRTFATLLEDEESVSLLEETLNEEKDTDSKLSALAEHINVEAEAEEMEIEDEEAESETRKPKTGSKRKRAA
jgi:ferritin-like metal-binding protein YciE